MARRPYTTIRRNVTRIIDGGGNERDVQEYLQSEGYNEQMWQAGTQAYNRSIQNQNRGQQRTNSRVNSLNAFSRGVDDGLFFNSSDEASGQRAAHNWQTRQYGQAARDLVTGNVKRATGRFNFVNSQQGRGHINNIRATATNESRVEQNRLRDEHPYANFAGNVVGGVAQAAATGGAVSGSARAASIAAARPIATAAAAGGVQGALYGAGDSIEGARVQGAAMGGVTGAALGGGLVGAGNAIRPIIQRGGNGRNVVNSPRNQRTAARFVLRNSPNISSEAQRLINAGVDNVTPVDTSTRLARGVNRMARGSNPESNALSNLSQAARSKTSSVPANANREIRRRGGANRTNQQLATEITERQRRAVQSRIQPVANQRIPLNETQTNILSSSNQMRRTANDAMDLLNLESSRLGNNNPLDVQILDNVVNGRNSPLEYDPINVGRARELPLDLSINGAETLRQGLQESASQAYNADRGNIARVLTATKNDFINPFREAVPQYDEALKYGENYHQAREAIDQGAQDITNRTLPDIQDNIAGLNPLARYAYGQGGVNRLADTFMNDRNSPRLLSRLMQSGDQQNALSTMIGSTRAGQIQNTAGALDQRLRNWTLANPDAGSQTARLMSEDGFDASRYIPSGKIQMLRDFASMAANKLVNYSDAERETIINMAIRHIDQNPNEYRKTLEDLADLEGGRIPVWLQGLVASSSGQTTGTALQ